MARKKAKASKPAAAQAEVPAVSVDPTESAQPVELARKAAAEPEPQVAETVEAAVEVIIESIQEGSEDMADKNQKTFEAGKLAADRIQAAFGDVNERAKVAVEKTTKIVEEMTELTKGNVEALVASSRLAVKGVETLGQEAADYGRRSFEEASAALKSFAEVKSPTDFFKLQSDYARSAFDSFVAESSKASEAVIKLAGEVAEPITSRYSVAAERVKALSL